MTKQEYEAAFNTALKVIQLLKVRIEMERWKSLSSVWASIESVLRYGVFLKSQPKQADMSDRQEWILSVGNAALSLGPVSCFILYQRLSKYQDHGDPNRNFTTIADKLDESGLLDEPMLPSEVEVAFKTAVPLFVLALEKAKVKIGYKPIESDRCAATERGMECAVEAVA